MTEDFTPIFDGNIIWIFFQTARGVWGNPFFQPTKNGAFTIESWAVVRNAGWAYHGISHSSNWLMVLRGYLENHPTGRNWRTSLVSKSPSSRVVPFGKGG